MEGRDYSIVPLPLRGSNPHRKDGVVLFCTASRTKKGDVAEAAEVRWVISFLHALEREGERWGESISRERRGREGVGATRFLLGSRGGGFGVSGFCLLFWQEKT